MTNTFTVKGLLGGDPELRSTQNGKAVCNFSVADTPRKYDQNQGAYIDAGPTLWTRCTMWGAEAERWVETAHKGDLVTITGRMKATVFNDRETGEERKSQEVTVETAYQHIKQTQGGNFGGNNGGSTPVASGHTWSTPQAQTSGGFGMDEEPPF